jgi:hypothetical protein
LPQVIESNLAKLQQLVPGLQPNLDQMKASEWVRSGNGSGISSSDSSGSILCSRCLLRQQ